VHHEWVVPPGAQQASWDREAARLSQFFGAPVWSANAPADLTADLARRYATPPSYCAVWRGPDSSLIVLLLFPTADYGPITLAGTWQLNRDAGYSAHPYAVACGMR
jgi:hypothetical protein